MTAEAIDPPRYGLVPHCALCSRPLPAPLTPRWIAVRTELGPRLVCPTCALLVVKAASVSAAAEPR